MIVIRNILVIGLLPLVGTCLGLFLQVPFANQNWKIHEPYLGRSSGVKVHVEFYWSCSENGTTIFFKNLLWYC